ncbi:MAG TPA: outer membrane lipid asymmetry maintenance protein MlaD [Oligoflexia bacterium]|nr:outer membrane lipid asymmetry maintenance protein MlaD [Oligoflexia bacterium]HMP49247.1 outer membrane lipid asymmetry maintenance protein MlaD [Oligoflexia bacterium]
MSSKAKSGGYDLGIEFWVGLFVLAGITAFSYLAINIAGIRFSDAGFYKIKAQFVDVAGLKLGAPVEVAGVRIGQVDSVKLEGGQALLTLSIKNGISLREDDIAQIRTKGIIGDKYVRISPGASEMLIEEGGKIFDTESSVDFEEIVGKFIHSIDKGKDE